MGRRGTDIWRIAHTPDGAWQHERMFIALLNERQQIGQVREVSPTELTAARLRRAFSALRLRKTTGLIVVHYQPTSLRTSQTTACAKRLRAVAAEIGVPLVDYVIFAGGRFHSMPNRRLH